MQLPVSQGHIADHQVTALLGINKFAGKQLVNDGHLGLLLAQCLQGAFRATHRDHGETVLGRQQLFAVGHINFQRHATTFQVRHLAYGRTTGSRHGHQPVGQVRGGKHQFTAPVRGEPDGRYAIQFAGLRLGPFPSWDLNRIAFHPDLVDAAERFCGTTDLQLYKVELWAKYSGGADYDQAHHRDYGNHSLVVPRRDGRWPQLTSFILLSDVTEEDGPTRVIPRSIGDEVPFVPRELEMGALVDEEVAVVGPAGSILLYTTDVLHRGSAMTGDRRSRFSLLADYSARGNPWMGKMSWPGLALQPGWKELVERASVRERDLFGFPPPGHEYWNDQTLADVQARYPGLDMTPYRERA